MGYPHGRNQHLKAEYSNLSRENRKLVDENREKVSRSTALAIGLVGLIVGFIMGVAFTSVAHAQGYFSLRTVCVHEIQHSLFTGPEAIITQLEDDVDISQAKVLWCKPQSPFLVINIIDGLQAQGYVVTLGHLVKSAARYGNSYRLMMPGGYCVGPVGIADQDPGVVWLETNNTGDPSQIVFTTFDAFIVTDVIPGSECWNFGEVPDASETYNRLVDQGASIRSIHLTWLTRRFNRSFYTPNSTTANQIALEQCPAAYVVLQQENNVTPGSDLGARISC